MAEAGRTDERPMSPHIQVWKWHATMAASIMHRATGVALYVGMLMISAWLVAAAMGPDAYAPVQALMFSLIGQLILFGFTLAILYHFANGIRHLIWDGPRAGFDPQFASAVSVFNFAFAILGAAAIWSASHFL
ncbi:MAG: succinate dehydrogenase, cytochrome b556 subunit [Pseudomonadota bacterium]